MTGRTYGFTKKFLHAIGALDVVVGHCMVHQENLCTNVLVFAEVIKNVVQCVNFFRARGLSRRHFKAFLEYLDCDYRVVVHFSALCWHSRAATLKNLFYMRQEIKLFMKSKHLNVAFKGDENWLT